MNSKTLAISVTEKGTWGHYGTQSLRLNKDSQQKFDQCGICLHDLIEPMCCQKGHLFCKQCVFENLLTQKKLNKKKLAQWEEDNKMKAASSALQKAETDKAKLDSFAKQDSSLLSDKVSASSGESDKQSTTKSWWLPEEAPHDAVSSVLAKPSQDTYCPLDNHRLKLKDLVEVHFKEEGRPPPAKDDEDVHHQHGTYICHVCSKDLKSVAKLSILRVCGHALCQKCCDEFAKKKCPICERPCDQKGEIVTVKAASSSFAEGGASVAKKSTPAPRMM